MAWSRSRSFQGPPESLTGCAMVGTGAEQLVAAAEAREASLNAAEEKLQALRAQLERDAKAHAEEAKSAVRRLKVPPPFHSPHLRFF